MDAIGDDELLYRRIPTSMENWCTPCDESPSGYRIDPAAFSPRSDDINGISVTRGDGDGESIVRAAMGHPGKAYFVALLRVVDLTRNGVGILPDPIEGNPNHALLPDLNYESRKSTQSIELRNLVSTLVFRVEGPYQTPEG